VKTQRRLRRYPNVQIVAGDALALLPASGTLFYLFNPFSEPWVAALKERLDQLFIRQNARMVLYYNCVHVDVFRNDPNWMVDEVELAPQFHRLALMRRRKAPLCVQSQNEPHMMNERRLSS